MNKILLIDKPSMWTSFDVVARIRGEIRKKLKETSSSHQTTNCQLLTTKIRVGHAGTLDPFATGLLIVLVGNETKNQDNYMKQDKEYVATLKLGYTSTTGDPEGEIIPFFPVISTEPKGERRDPSGSTKGFLQQGRNDNPSLDDVELALKNFLGEISQIPPIYSAIKIDGKRAYALARAGEIPDMKPRIVRIIELRIENYEYPELQILVKCSSGTYIRTLAEDIGKALGTGAYLTALRRTKIGDYDVKNALTVEKTLTSLREM